MKVNYRVSQSVTSANLFKQAFIMTFSDSKEHLSLLYIQIH